MHGIRNLPKSRASHDFTIFILLNRFSMPLKCPECSKYTLKCEDRLNLRPRWGAWAKRPDISCPRCHARIGTTLIADLAFYTSFFACVFASGFIQRIHSNESMSASILLLFFGGIALNFWMIWPNIIIRVKEWQSWQEALTQSRLIGYSYVVSLPLIIVGLGLLFL